MLKILVSLCYVCLSAALGGCHKNDVSPNPPGTGAPTDTARTAKTYLALGDSYTIGQSVSATDRYPYQAVSILSAQGIAVRQPDYIAQTGWTTVNLQSAIDAQRPSANYDLVTLLIGVNDQYQGRDTASYRAGFTHLLQEAVRLAGNRATHVVVLSIPDYSATPFAAPTDKARISREIGWFNAINKQVTLNAGIKYIDITPLTLQAANDPTLLASDQLHYSGKEMQQWAALLAPALAQSLQ